ncbi:hypothetical protein H5410_017249 [Solanum commersonii]|uniref:Uncharacterized protein n=1 Tax=Solanum commersonii TaxID=4109 RepID=A0A9J5ZYS0_SOLCO|nr:hypothetical protein H5410_017249 [Solanum commersonii]
MDLEIRRARRKKIAFDRPRIKWGGLTPALSREMGEKLIGMGAWSGSGDADAMWNKAVSCIRKVASKVLGVSRGNFGGHKGDGGGMGSPRLDPSEEERELRNHLKWARLKSDLDERRGIPINTQRSEEVSSQKGEDSLLGFTEVTGHVGSSYDPKISKWPASPARDITCTPRAHHSILPKKAILVNKGKKLGPDILAQSISNGLPAETSFSLLLDPFVVELEANLITSSSTTPHQAEELVTAQGLSLREEEILKEKRGAETAMGNIVDTSEIMWQQASTCIQGSNPQSTEVVSTSLIPFEEAVPLNQLSPEEGDDPEFDVPIWIHQNINKLAKEFGVDIKGCKDEALSLFMKIDGGQKRDKKLYRLAKAKRDKARDLD